ncbi:heme/hemin ABC transporter substrate-binding protein [Rubrimonas cliftonensis]|uniref:Iron complex transport system substrate-binding protein n=1 Tax=Rubrimonas cliftonensis TaxID=89524 RepID=A0A1H4F0Z7_9RHOB|nr:ABC transporter substrate-binding protein [Rubrimonas cliftonensis]SEA90620.1 iron complex transport system substrate-binding protein [Rubrimonas cliftonensis]
MSGRMLARAAAAGAMVAVAAVAAAQERLVIAGPGVTEIVFALGAGARVVGVDALSTHPPEADALPDVGYFRRLSAEGLLSLSPDMVLAAESAGPHEILAQLGAAGVGVARIPDADDPDGVPARIDAVATAIGTQAAAGPLIADYRRRLAQARAAVAARPGGARALFVLGMQGGAPVVAGAGTVADAMIREAGAVNAADGFEGFRPMSPEALVGARPDVVLMLPERLKAVGGARALLAEPGFGATPAGREGRVATMEAGLLLRLGPRSADAVAQLAELLAPR